MVLTTGVDPPLLLPTLDCNKMDSTEHISSRSSQKSNQSPVEFELDDQSACELTYAVMPVARRVTSTTLPPLSFVGDRLGIS